MMDGMTGAGSARLPTGTVTFLLTDVEGSSRLWEASPTEAPAVIARHRDILAEAIERHGGARPVEQGEGDSVVAAFERASNAVRAAVDAQQALAVEEWPAGGALRVRMALHSGEAVPATDGTYAGAVLNRCARLRVLAHGGQVLMSEVTRDLVVDQLDEELELRDLGVHRLRDLSRLERVWQVVAPRLLDVFPPLRSLDAAPNNLPLQLSSFVGRDDDIATSVALMDETRLLTLTGSGGCGKTRLALRVAAEVSDRFGDGVWWVALAPLADGDLIATTVASAMRIRVPPDREPEDVVVNHLASHAALVVLDNCEHLTDAAARFADRLLRAVPSSKILATSREPLAVEGEVTWRVPALALPPDRTVEPDRLGQYDAVTLFIDRAVQVRPNFAVTNANAPAVAEICHRLDGIPLAIELAAARTRVMTPDSIAAELDNRFRLLAGGARTVLPRHQTLMASIDWSHDLLDPDERALLRRLGVFAGGFSLDAAEAVGAAPPLDREAVLDVLARLVNKSLVQLDGTSMGRYSLLETVRHYAQDRLEEAGEEPATRDRHLAWLVDLAEGLEPETTNAHAGALDRLEIEHANLRDALEWASSSGRVDDLLRLIAGVGFFWAHRGHFVDSRRWMTVVDAVDAGASTPLLARAQWMAAHVGFLAGDTAIVKRLAANALTDARGCGDRQTEARWLHTVGSSLLFEDTAASRTLVAEAADIAHECGDQWCEADSLQLMSFSYLAQGRADEAEEALRRSVVIVEALDNDFQRAWHYIHLGLIALQRGQLDESYADLQRALQLARRIGDPFAELWVCITLAYRAVYSGDPGAVDTIAEDLTSQDREWGTWGDALILMFEAMGRIVDAPRDAATTLTAVGEGLLASSDGFAGTVVLWAAALAALEAEDDDTAERLATHALNAARPVETMTTAALDIVLGRVALARGDHAAAEARAHAALAFQRQRGLRTWLGDTLELLGRAAIAAESWAEGCRLIAAGNAFRNTTGQRRLPSTEREVQASLEAGKAALGEDFESVWAAGEALSADDAAAYARRARGERKRPSFGWDSLTPTEMEVVRLVALGLANPAIAERMFITSGTVKTHLKHVFAKLGVTSRAELATEATRHELA